MAPVTSQEPTRRAGNRQETEQNSTRRLLRKCSHPITKSHIISYRCQSSEPIVSDHRRRFLAVEFNHDGCPLGPP